LNRHSLAFTVRVSLFFCNPTFWSEPITGQMVALLTLMKELGILDESQYDEFRAYLMHSLTYQSNNG
jgi:hypothetical protein